MVELTNVEWNYDINLPTRAYLVGGLALWQYGQRVPTLMDAGLAKYRGQMVDRKKWKVVTKPWFEHVMSHWHLGLTWEGKPKRSKPVKWPVQQEYLGPFYTYETIRLRSVMDCPADLDITSLKVARYDRFFTTRKSWKHITAMNRKMIAMNLGGHIA